ncbi:MAG: TolC family protein [Planctomycetes bacterium]|nr:TolC family protein [Planctomycetota bacterium]
MRDQRTTGFVLLASICAACATIEVDPSAEQQEARGLIRDTTGRADVFDPSAAPVAPEEIDAALADGLGLDEALRLALLDSRRLQAGFLGLGVARADFVQAGLLRNPSLGVGFLIPSNGGRPQLSADLVQSLVDLWELPERQAVAEGALQQQVFELSRFAGELVVDTKDAYFESVGARDLLAIARENARVAQAAFEAVRKQVEGGVATAIEEHLARSQALGAELAVRSAERESVGARRRLAALLSIDVDLMEVELTDALPEPAPRALDREALVARSRSTRLDVRAAGAALTAAEAQLALERRRTTPNVDVGLALERPEAGSAVDLLAGPGATIELPIFDRNQAQVRRAEFRRDQLGKEHEALVGEVGQQVRAAVDRAVSSARTAQFVAEDLLPQAERGAALARTAFELGHTTALSFLESQRAALQARRSRIEALLDAARTQVDVERVVGASLTVLDPR